jgi:hypothetical protein
MVMNVALVLHDILEPHFRKPFDNRRLGPNIGRKRFRLLGEQNKEPLCLFKCSLNLRAKLDTGNRSLDFATLVEVTDSIRPRSSRTTSASADSNASSRFETAKSSRKVRLTCSSSVMTLRRSPSKPSVVARMSSELRRVCAESSSRAVPFDTRAA